MVTALDRGIKKCYNLVKMDNDRKQLDKSRLMDLYYNHGKTLQDIGDEYGITRERVRQLMSKYDLPRLKRPQRHPRGFLYKTLDEYCAAFSKRARDNKTMTRFLNYVECAECGRSKFLDVHHINYPTMSEDDIQILCKSCHKLKHNDGMTYEKQLLLFAMYKDGVPQKEIMAEFGISQSLVTLIIRKIKKGYKTLRAY
ncbi:hypothetical protein LCGC14_1828790 [marine sediment metagenome]|uniref:RNA polymerase sigma-70 region 4 domain-containing protein n=1 Tax=marine sediment metagenome TaxID=412755 RepID=A0A0F9GGP5_9ZZZZ